MGESEVWQMTVWPLLLGIAVILLVIGLGIALMATRWRSPRSAGGEIPWYLSDLLESGPFGERTTRTVREVGALVLPSGRIGACDAMFVGLDDGCASFARTVRPGRYPAWVCIAGDDIGEYIAAAFVRFASEPVASWELATLPGQRVDRLSPGNVFVYAVDSGAGCFCSPEAAAQVARDHDYCDRMIAELERAGEGLATARLQVGEANVIAFESGGGDGGYASWWGLSATGEAVCLLTDFDVL